jgi:hypothetical protein
MYATMCVEFYVDLVAFNQIDHLSPSFGFGLTSSSLPPVSPLIILSIVVYSTCALVHVNGGTTDKEG